jgi:pimeloyl-ACP methyl ester carboxylesterase
MVKVPISRKSPKCFPPAISGAIKVEEFDSRVLEGNPLGDPVRRKVAYYTPPSGETEGKPLLVILTGFTGSGWMHFLPAGFLGEALYQKFDRLVRDRVCGEAVLVAPDCITSLGGSQHVNSSATGRYEDYVVKEIVPWAREKFHTGSTGVLGQSSGGFGALHLAIEHPDLFQAVGSSSGDMAFEHCYLPDIPKAVNEFKKVGGPEEFLAKMFEEPGTLKGPTDPSGSAINMLAMAACYSPRDSEPGEFDLPFDPMSGEMIPITWDRWLAFDPVRRLSTRKGKEALLRLRLVHVTASSPDEYALDIGARIFAAAASRQGVPVVHEEFVGGHFTSGPRFETLFTRMVGALTDKGR